MAELTWTSPPVSAANQRDPSFITRTPRRAGFQPPLMVGELRFRAVSRETSATDGAAATGSATGRAGESGLAPVAGARLFREPRAEGATDTGGIGPITGPPPPLRAAAGAGSFRSAGRL